MMTSAEANMTETMKYYENYGRKGADFPVNFNLLSLTRGCGGQCVYDKVDSWWKLKPSGGWANWMVSGSANRGPRMYHFNGGQPARTQLFTNTGLFIYF